MVFLIIYKEETTMNMKKILALLLAAVLLVGVLSACGNGEANAPSASEEPAAEAGVRTVKDVLGREVEIASDIQTVACPGLPSTRMVVYAGAVDKIAGVTENEKMELACAPCSDVFHDKFFDLPSIGSGWPNSEIYQEELVVLDPDAIILFTNEAAQADELQEQIYQR
jgi:iron complex transport system substrate-binding protein